MPAHPLLVVLCRMVISVLTQEIFRFFHKTDSIFHKFLKECRAFYRNGWLSPKNVISNFAQFFSPSGIIGVFRQYSFVSELFISNREHPQCHHKLNLSAPSQQFKSPSQMFFFLPHADNP